MHTSVELHLAYQLANAPVLPFPFPHMLVRDVFPADFYREIRANLPRQNVMKSLKETGLAGHPYPDGRAVLPLDASHLEQLQAPERAFWSELGGWILSGPFANLMLAKFGEIVSARTDLADRQLSHEAMLVRDQTRYFLGPHTDRPSKVISVLFYLPGDATRPHLGTSVYIPSDGSFRCAGGPHHRFEDFQRVYTMPYVPNTLFAFAKSDHSFHGVEPLTGSDEDRDLLLYDIFVQDLRQGAPGAVAGPATPGTVA